MNRPIKFKAWDAKYKEMVNDIHIAPEYDWLVLSDNDALAERDNRGRKKGEEYVLMQFTGLHDKNGKEIYEGDIISDGASTMQIVWNDKLAAFEADMVLGRLALRGWEDDPNTEIIGNIYENPELINTPSE